MVGRPFRSALGGAIAITAAGIVLGAVLAQASSPAAAALAASRDAAADSVPDSASGGGVDKKRDDDHKNGSDQKKDGGAKKNDDGKGVVSKTCGGDIDPVTGMNAMRAEIENAPQVRIAQEWNYLPNQGAVRLMVFQPFDSKISWQVFVVGNNLHQAVRNDNISVQEATTGDNGTDFLAKETTVHKTLLEYRSNLVSTGLHGWTSDARIIVVGCSLDEQRPSVQGILDTKVSYSGVSAMTAIALCIFFYLVAAWATFYIRSNRRMVTDKGIEEKGIQRFRWTRPPHKGVWNGKPISGTNYASLLQHLDPVVLTAGSNGKGSATKLQILLFSICVFGAMSYLLLMTGRLSGLSTNVLLLIGISGVGGAAAAGTDVAKSRLSFDNWAWLIQNHWLPKGGLAEESMAEWKDIFTTDGEFDVYHFQMVTFSVMVALSLVGFAVRIDDLSHFQLSSELLGILGLSQVVYIAGKLVAPPTIRDLNDQISKLQDAENALRAKVDAAGLFGVQVAFVITDDIKRVMTEYQTYLKAWNDTQTMFESTLGRDVPLEGERLRPPFALTQLTDAQPASLPDAKTGEPYVLNLKATGGAGALYTWTDPEKALPPGLSITGEALTGSPTGPAPEPGKCQTYKFKLVVTDSNNSQKSRWFEIRVY